MEIILDFFVDNYLWFLIISLILIFGLIGYIVDSREKRTPKLHFGDNEELNMNSTDVEDKSLKEMLEITEEELVENSINMVSSEPNLTINDVLNKTEETKETELPEE